jgi:hypothetical protein
MKLTARYQLRWFLRETIPSREKVILLRRLETELISKDSFTIFHVRKREKQNTSRENTPANLSNRQIIITMGGALAIRGVVIAPPTLCQAFQMPCL